MTGPEYDAELEAFLKRRSPMHRRLSDIDHAEPSAELDRVVLNRAREAIDAPSQPLFRTSRWALPMGLAAAILIAFTVVLNIDRHARKTAAPAAATVAPEGATREPAAARAAPANDSVAESQPRLLSDPIRREAATNSAVFPPAQATASAAARSAPPPAPAPSGAAADPHSNPDAWLREISRLRAAGRIADADRELVAFREAYPTHPAYAVAKPPAR